MAAVVLAVAFLSGCQFAEQTIIPCPLAFHQQEKEILSVVPLGTPREAAVVKLSKAGIEGSFGERAAFFGVKQSVYYCDLWRRKDNKHWHIDVALLFDEDGKLYKTRPANAITEVIHTNKNNAENAKSRPTAKVGPDRRERSSRRVRQSRRQRSRDDGTSF